MERQKILTESKAISFLYLIFIVGTIGHLLASLKSLMLLLTPYTLLITGSVVFYVVLREANVKLFFWAVITFLVTFILEAYGVKTGVIFGEYSYGDVLGLKLFEVPLIIGFNWVMVMLGAISIAYTIDRNVFLVALLASTLAVLFDMVLEPVAMKLGYWNWGNNIIPIQNYYAWFGITFISTLFTGLLRLKISYAILDHYFIIQLVFFILLMLFI